MITSISKKTVQQCDQLSGHTVTEASNHTSSVGQPDIIQRMPHLPHMSAMMGPQPVQHTIVRAQMHQIPAHLQHLTRPAAQVMSPIQFRSQNQES